MAYLTFGFWTFPTLRGHFGQHTVHIGSLYISAMPSRIYLSWTATVLLALSQSAATTFLQGRQRGPDSAYTSFPQVPSFTQASLTYGSYLQVYSTGYTVPSDAVDTVTVTATAVASSSSDAFGFGQSPAERSQIRYLQSICAPSSSNAETEFDTRFPCNVVSNLTLTCIFNLTSDSSGPDPAELDAQAQQQCLCPGGAGETIWENAAG